MMVPFIAKTLSPVCKTPPGTHRYVWNEWTNDVGQYDRVLPDFAASTLQGWQGRPPGGTVALPASVMNLVLSHLQQPSKAPANPSRLRCVERTHEGRKGMSCSKPCAMCSQKLDADLNTHVPLPEHAHHAAGCGR